MAKQSPIYTRTSIAVFALFTIASSWPAFGQGHVPSAKDLAKGSPYRVFLSQKPRKEHQEAIIAVVQTRTKPNAAYGLVFLQTKETNHIGLGIVCENSEAREDSALECHQTVGDKKETLRVGAIGSKFCDDLKKEIKRCVDEDQTRKKHLYTSDGENPIVDECNPGPCICFQISHNDAPVCPPEVGPDAPPNSGTGTGGHN